MKTKPSGWDIHLQYTCKCGNQYWISTKENMTDGFKIVCAYCDNIIIPQKIANIKVHYEQLSKSKKSDKKPVPKMINSAAITLEDLGFDKKEAMDLCLDFYNRYQPKTTSDLVKKIMFDYGATT